MNYGDEVVTASAYVVWRGRYVFMVGFPAGADDRLGVARLGGHREGDEGAWACAAREVREESSLRIRPLAPPATYWLGPGQDEHTMEERPWPGAADSPPDEAPPLLVGWRPGAEGAVGGAAGRRFSVTYLAEGEGKPVPAAEAQGLLLLRPDEVRAVARRGLTLGALVDSGGEAHLRAPLPAHLPLEPLAQLRILAVLLDRHEAMAAG